VSKNIWQKTLDEINTKISQKTFDTFFKSTHLLKKKTNALVIQTDDEFVKDWLIDHYLDMIIKTLKKQNGRNYHIEFKLKDDHKKETRLPRKIFQSLYNNNFNINYTFDKFIVGKNNQFAHAISQGIIESPGKTYNPFFIYGGVGLGKTHLLHAIGHAISKRYPKMKIGYLSAEQFTNEFIQSLRKHTPEVFQKKYRSIDFLLVDDVQFFCGKNRSQEEFFHTFNALWENGRQLVLSSDRPPKELQNMEDRLRSRIGSGLIADIQVPDFETRVAILRLRADEVHISVPDDVLHLIGNCITTNIRDLESAFKTIVAQCFHQNRECTAEKTEEILSKIIPSTPNNRSLTIDLIQRAVSKYYNISLSDILSKNRSKNIALSRQIAMYITRELTKMSLPEIGREFGNRDHSTVVHSTNKIVQLLNEDKEIKNDVASIIKVLQ